MTYPARVQEILKRYSVGEGDEVRAIARGKTFEGIIMPHHAFSAEDILTLKLSSNGYNIGLAVADIERLEPLGHREPRKARPPVKTPAGEKPPVAFLSTGGTIASYVEYKTGAVHPALTAEDLIFSVPDLVELAQVRARVVYSILSEDMRAEYWQRLAREVAKEFGEGTKGVVIPHGTDTLGYTTAALSFMLQDLPGPVAVVGAQRSPDRPSSDAPMNLLAATRLATVDLGEVVAVMHGTTSDDHCDVHRGTKVRKMHSSRRDAFRSINEQPLGRVFHDGRVEFSSEHKARGKGPRLDDRMEPRVNLLYYFPGMSKGLIDAACEDAKGLVVAGTGLGHVATDLIPHLGSWVERGVHIVMTTQCLYGRTGMLVYSGGRDLIGAGVIPGEDMLPETALVKLMWVLARAERRGEVARWMATNVAGEMNPKIKLEDFES